MSPEQHAPSTGPRRHGPRVWARWVRRIARHSLWVLLLVLIVLGAFVYYVPVSSATLNRRVASAFESQTGLRVRFDDARLFAAQRRYSLENVRLFAGADERPVLTVERVDASVLVLRLLTGRRTWLDSVDLTRPSGIDLVYDDRGVRAGPGTQLMLDSVRAVGSQSERRGPLPFRTLRLSDARVAVSEYQSTGSLESFLNVKVGTGRGFLLTDLDATLEAGARDGRLAARFSGRIIAEDQESFVEGRAEHVPGERLTVRLDVPELDLAGLTTGEPDSLVSAAGVVLNADLGLGPGERKTSVDLTADRLAVRLPARGVDIADTRVRFGLEGSHNAEAGILRARRISLQGDALDAEADGTVETSAPHAFRVRLLARSLGEPWRRLLARYVPERWAVAARDNSILLDVTAEGDSAGVAGLTGKLRFEDISVSVRGLEKPVTGLRGEVAFEPARVELHGFSGEYGRTRLDLEGAIHGDFLAGREGRLSLVWRATASPDDILSAFRFATPRGTSLPATPRRSSGLVTTTGTLEQFVSLREPERTSLPEIQADVELAGVELSHPLLPHPVSGLNGTARVRDNRVLIDRLRGGSRGGNFTMNGVMQGDGTFWNDPWLTGTLSMDFDLADAAAWAPPRNRAEVAALGLAGKATLDVDLGTPLPPPAGGDPATRGVVQFSDVAFRPRFEFMHAQVTGLGGRLTWSGDSVRLQRCEGLVNGERLSVTGMLARDQILLDLAGAAQLQNVHATFPRATRWVEMSGPASGDLHLRITDGGGTEPPARGSLAALLASAERRINDAVTGDRYSLEGSLSFGNGQTGAAFRHKSMPPARRDARGRAVPQGDITGIRGTVRVRNQTFTVAPESPLTGSFADTRNCRVHGTLEFRRGSFPRLDFTLDCAGRANFDPWVLEWGRGPRPPDAPPAQPGPPGKTFDLSARINAPSGGSFRGQDVDRVTLDLTYRLTVGQPRVTRIRRLDVTGLGGSATGSATLESSPWLGRERSIQWNTDVDIRSMRIAGLRRIVLDNDGSVDGVITTRLDVSGTSRQRDTYRGQGVATLTEVDIGRTPMALSLFQVPGLMQGTQRNFQHSRFSTLAPARYTIANGALDVRGLQFATQGLIMGVGGRYLLDGRLDLVLQMKVLQSSLLGDIPLLDEAAKLVDTLAGQILAFRVRGTTTNPVVEPAPLGILQPQ